MSAPQYLTAYGTGNAWSGPYEWHATGTGSESHLEIYKNNTTGNNSSHNWHLYTIAVNTTTNTWVDYGTDHPFDSPSENTESNGDITVTLTSSGTQLFKFLKPVVSGWGSSSGGGGTATEGGSGTQKKVFCNFW